MFRCFICVGRSPEVEEMFIFELRSMGNAGVTNWMLSYPHVGSPTMISARLRSLLIGKWRSRATCAHIPVRLIHGWPKHLPWGTPRASDDLIHENA